MSARGWCPVDDRVYEGTDGVCPDCGTALVSLAEGKKRTRSLVVFDESANDVDPEPIAVETGATRPRAAEEEPVRVGVAAIAAAAAVVVVGAFFLGVAVTRGSRTDRPEAGAPRAREDYQVGSIQSGAGVKLRLDSFSQRGRDIVARVTVPPQRGIEIGEISSILVIPLTARTEGVGQAPLDVRTTSTGFIAAGRVVRDAGTPVTGLEIVSMTQNVSPIGGLLPVDVSAIWPIASGGSPKATGAHGTAGFSDGRSFRLTGLVGWPDRIEAELTVSRDPAGWVYDERFSMLFELQGRFPGRLVDSPAGIRHVIFDRVPRSASSGGLEILVRGVTITGHWRWMFT
jgi:hypothetical protein